MSPKHPKHSIASISNYAETILLRRWTRFVFPTSHRIHKSNMMQHAIFHSTLLSDLCRRVSVGRLHTDGTNNTVHCIDKLLKHLCVLFCSMLRNGILLFQYGTQPSDSCRRYSFVSTLRDVMHTQRRRWNCSTSGSVRLYVILTFQSIGIWITDRLTGDGGSFAFVVLRV